MRQDAHLYTESARSHVRLVRQYSPNAAAVLESILKIYGAKAAYMAAIAIIDSKAQADRLGYIRVGTSYAGFIGLFPEASPLLQNAMKALMSDRGIGGSMARSVTKSS